MSLSFAERMFSQFYSSFDLQRFGRRLEKTSLTGTGLWAPRVVFGVLAPSSSTTEEPLAALGSASSQKDQSIKQS